MFKYLPKIVFGLSALLAVEIISLVITPSASATTLDLTTKGSSGYINNALFQQISDTNAAGTGTINSFLRIQAVGNEEGYNTDYRAQGGDKLQFDEKSDIHTRSLLLKDVPIVKVGNVNYRQFILDINEPNAGNKALLTLDSMKIFLGNAPDLHNYSPDNGFGTNAAQIYNLDAGLDSTIKLKDINPGSGRYDMFAYVPDELFKASSNPYVYLYSSFKDADANGGFEEWAVNKATVIVPEEEPKKAFEPSTGAAFLLVTLGMFGTRRRKKQIA